MFGSTDEAKIESERKKREREREREREFWILRAGFDRFRRMRPMRLLLEGRGGGGRRRFHLLLLLLEQLLVLLLPRLRSSEILIVDGVTTVLR
jgi:hypothetical protein